MMNIPDQERQEGEAVAVFLMMFANRLGECEKMPARVLMMFANRSGECEKMPARVL